MANDFGGGEEELLPGGNITAGVVRVGQTVRRPIGPASAWIHAFLRHLHEEGFGGAPRILGVDDRGREVLSFHPGSAIWPDQAALIGTDDTLRRAGVLVRDFHRASSTFVPPPDIPWWDGSLDPEGGTMLLHGDLAPWNVIAGGADWIIIDWDTVSPGRIEWELAYVLLTFVPLWHNTDLLDSEVVRRLAVFADTYQLRAAQLIRALSLIPIRCRRMVAFMRNQAASGHPAFAAMVEEEHDTHWLAGAVHVEARLPQWSHAHKG